MGYNIYDKQDNALNSLKTGGKTNENFKNNFIRVAESLVFCRNLRFQQLEQQIIYFVNVEIGKQYN